MTNRYRNKKKNGEGCEDDRGHPLTLWNIDEKSFLDYKYARTILVLRYGDAKLLLIFL